MSEQSAPLHGDTPPRVLPDLRAPVLGGVAWLAALGTLHLSVWWLLAALALALVALIGRRRRGLPTGTHAAWLVTGVGVALLTLLRLTAHDVSPVTALAEQHAAVQMRLVTTSDPVLHEGRFADYVVLRARAEMVEGRAVRHRVRSPVLVVADRGWQSVPLGTTLDARGRLAPPRTQDLTGVLSPRGPPEVVATPGRLFRAADALRASVRSAVAHHAPGPRTLVPALVDGDDAGMPGEITESFRVAGLTHLLAVSGTNLTLVVGSLLILARWGGVRARGLLLVGVVGVAGFVLLARTEPSVLRAAVMGSVALLGMGTNGRARGGRALGVAVLGLLLVDPWLAQSAGFALSTLATAGILWLAPGWRDRLVRWLPRWVAEAISVPLAAQLACTPLVAGLSGQVSLVAVVANLAAAPLVGPATVLGLGGGVVGLVWSSAGQVVAAPAAWCASVIITVAVRSAALPVAAVDWSAQPWSIGVLTAICLVLALTVGAFLSRPVAAIALGLLMVLAVLVPLPTPGWPPRGWVMVACDVGQGDGLVLRAGEHRAVVVDTGPDPAAMDSCLDRLGIQEIPLVVLTHFHADHIDGLAGALDGRAVGAIEVTSLADPLGGVREVEAVARQAGVEVRRASYGESGRVGDLRWQVIGPSHLPSGDSASPPNDASLVLLVDVHGVRLLLMGDEEEPSQAQLWRDTGRTLRADVLKVTHHGSARQDSDLVRGIGARLAVISVGVDNDYGHPAPRLLALLRGSRMQVARTDQDGDVAVIVDHAGTLRLRSRG